jgi:hypothetical protein
MRTDSAWGTPGSASWAAVILIFGKITKNEQSVKPKRPRQAWRFFLSCRLAPQVFFLTIENHGGFNYSPTTSMGQHAPLRQGVPFLPNTAHGVGQLVLDVKKPGIGRLAPGVRQPDAAKAWPRRAGAASVPPTGKGLMF